MRNIYRTIGVFTALFAQILAFGQSPYDSFDKKQSEKHTYQLSEMIFRAESVDTTGIIRYVELDIETLFLKCFSANDSLVAEVQLEQGDVKFISRDPLFNARHWLSPYAYCSNNPINRIDPTGMLDDEFNVNTTTGIITKISNLGGNEFDMFHTTKSHENGGETHINTYVFEKNQNGLINMQNNQYGINTHGQSGTFMSPLATAAMLGVMDLTGFSDISIGNFSRQDGSSPPPSTSHKNGNNGDLRPLRTDQAGTPVTVNNTAFDKQRNTDYVSALRKFGWTDILSETNNSGYITPGTRHFSGYTDKKTGQWVNSRHHDHFHTQGFQPNYRTNIQKIW